MKPFKENWPLKSKISKKTNLLLDEIVMVAKGGNSFGTWMHEYFEHWLSIDFSLQHYGTRYSNAIGSAIESH